MNGSAAYLRESATGHDAGTERLVNEHLILVKRIAHHLAGRLPPSVQVEDLMQAGMIGLLEAARQYQAVRGASFATYAGIRIRGAMLDEVRRADWTPRSVHRRARELATATREVENATGRSARGQEVAERLGIGMEEYHAALRDATTCKVFSYDDPEWSDGNWESGEHAQEGPEGQDEKRRFQDALAAVIESLPEREKMVLSLYYDEELNLKEIGAVLGVSESRVCQIHGQALVRVRSKLESWKGTVQ